MGWYWNKFNRNFLINHEAVNSRTELIDLLSGLHQNYFGENKKKHLWFRGSINVNYKLVPSIYRHESLSDIDSVSGQIIEIYNLFEDYFSTAQTRIVDRIHSLYGNSYSIPKAQEVINWVSLMQHYRFPSWFLDWSLNSDASIYFAIEHLFNKEINICKTEVLPCIWVLNPHKMNDLFWSEAYLDDVPDDHWIDGIVKKSIIQRRIPNFNDLEKSKLSAGYSIAHGTSYKSEKEIQRFEITATTRPINLIPLADSKRVITQKGMFTGFPIQPYHADNTGNHHPYQFFIPLDSYCFSNEFLTCIQFSDPDRLKNDLLESNFHPWDVYPEVGYAPGAMY